MQVSDLGIKALGSELETDGEMQSHGLGARSPGSESHLGLPWARGSASSHSSLSSAKRGNWVIVILPITAASFIECFYVPATLLGTHVHNVI